MIENIPVFNILTFCIIRIILGLYRIVVVDEFANVIWKGPMDRRYNVSLIYNNEHFDGLKSIAGYFKHKKYCIGWFIHVSVLS